MSAVVPPGYKQTEVGVIPEDWEVSSVGDVLNGFRNGYAFSAEKYVASGMHVITMAQIGLDGSFNFDTRLVSKWNYQEAQKLKDFFVFDGDVLISMTDVTPQKNLIGRMTIARLAEPALLNQRCSTSV